MLALEGFQVSAPRLRDDDWQALVFILMRHRNRLVKIPREQIGMATAHRLACFDRHKNRSLLADDLHIECFFVDSLFAVSDCKRLLAVFWPQDFSRGEPA